MRTWRRVLLVSVVALASSVAWRSDPIGRSGDHLALNAQSRALFVPWLGNRRDASADATATARASRVPPPRASSTTPRPFPTGAVTPGPPVRPTPSTTPASASATPAHSPSPSPQWPMPTAEPSPTDGPSPTPTRLPATATASPSPLPLPCDALPTFEDGKRPSAEHHVALSGSDETGDGSAERPYRSIARAAREAQPGSAIRIHPGTYAGGSYLEGLAGREDAPIWIGGLPGQEKPRIEGGSQALHLVRGRWLIVHDLSVSGPSSNGINADDGGDVDDPAASHHLIFRNLEIDDVGGGGNQDCLKLSGLRDVWVLDSSFSHCGGGGSGSGVDMVGVHRAKIARNLFLLISGNAVQAKGGSADVDIVWNTMHDAGVRAVNMGGSTGKPFFRPPLDPESANAEARRIRVMANLIIGGDTPWAFVGCVDCLAAHNTVSKPRIWLMRILHESRSDGEHDFEPARRGRVESNLFVFERGQLRSDVNVGLGTESESFTFSHNLFYAEDDPARSWPNLPAPDENAVIGEDPQLSETYWPGMASPAVAAGRPEPHIAADRLGACYLEPPSIGAFEGGLPPPIQPIR